MSRSYTAYDVQKIRLEKLMNNIVFNLLLFLIIFKLKLIFFYLKDKPIEIPTKREDKKFAEPPDFVRNIMGFNDK